LKTTYLKIVFSSLILIILNPWILPISGAQETTNEAKNNEKGQIVIRKETGPSGHSTIGIDESSIEAASKKALALTFSNLMTWEYDADGNSPPPEKIKKLDGRKVKLVGFMYPLQQGESIQYFCLLRTTQTCCYGPRPQFNQYVFVEMQKPTKFFRLDPVSCEGKFRVEPTPEEGYIYRVEGEKCESVSKKDKRSQ
jgi:hypothetical protein